MNKCDYFRSNSVSHLQSFFLVLDDYSGQDRCGRELFEDRHLTDVKDALKKPVKMGDVRILPDDDVRQTFYGAKAAVTISIRDNRLIQVNPWKGDR